MPPRKQAAGPRPKRVLRSSTRRGVPGSSPSASDSISKSPDHGNAQTATQSTPEIAVVAPSPLTGTETVLAKPSITTSSVIVEQEGSVENKQQSSSMDTRVEGISTGTETLAQASENARSPIETVKGGHLEITRGIGTEIEETGGGEARKNENENENVIVNESVIESRGELDSNETVGSAEIGDFICGSGEKRVREDENANGDSVDENGAMKKKKKIKVVKVVKKVVKKRVPKKVLEATSGFSNKELEKEEVLNDGSEKISSSDGVSLPMQEVQKINLNEGHGKVLTLEQDTSDGDEVEKNGTNVSVLVQEAEKPDSLISAPVAIKNSDIVVLDPQINLFMEDDNKKMAEVCEGEKEDSVGEIRLDGEQKVDAVEKSDSASEMPVEAANVNLLGSRIDECRDGALEGTGGYEGAKEAEKDDDVDTGSGGIVLSGELEALERRKRRKTEIFIGGLNTDAKEDDVRKVFEELGEVLEVRLVVNNKTGKSKGYAFVRYASAADAKMALEKHSNVKICGKQCSVAPVEGNDTLYLGNIDKKWKNEDVIKLLQEIGIEKIDKVTVMVDPNNVERNRGFAFLELETNKDAQIAFKKLQKKDILGKLQNVKVAWAEPLSEPDEEEMLKVKAVYAEYLPSSWNEEEVKGYFRKFGEIDNVVHARNLHSRRKDFAFINFKTREAALACIESFKHVIISDEGSKVNVKVSLAKPIPKGKVAKKISRPTSKENSKQKMKATRPAVKPTALRNKGISAAEINDGNTGDTHSSKSAELEQLLAERALWRQTQARLGIGLTNTDYSSPLTGRKRSFYALGDDPYHSDPRAYSRMRLESSFPYGSPSSAEVPQGFGRTAPYHQRQGPDYASGYRYTDYADSFQREEAPRHGKW